MISGIKEPTLPYKCTCHETLATPSRNSFHTADSYFKLCLQRSLQQAQTYGGQSTVKRSTTSVSGTASSIAFTPLQGLEIVNPHAAEKKVANANAKYFSSTAGFLKVTKK